MCTGNDIGAEGAKGLGEALKLNSTITTLYLRCMKHFMIFHDVDRFIYIHYMGCVYVYVQAMLLVMKELKHWEKH
jgi:hypothetical protein